MKPIESWAEWRRRQHRKDMANPDATVSERVVMEATGAGLIEVRVFSPTELLEMARQVMREDKNIMKPLKK